MKYTKEMLMEAAENSTSVSGVLRFLGIERPSGSTHNIVSKRLREFEIDTSHFNKNPVRAQTFNRKPKDDILVVLPNGSNRTKRAQLVRAMLESEIRYVCSLCGLTDSWNGATLSLEVDHINGNCLDNTIENLRFLCPNCHSQQSTNLPIAYRTKEPKKQKVKAIEHMCSVCWGSCSPKATKCRKCEDASRKPVQMVDTEGNVYLMQEVHKMAESMTYKQLGDMFNVSDSAIKKKIRRAGLEPPRKYK